MTPVETFKGAFDQLCEEDQNEFIRPFLSLGGVDNKDLKLALCDEINGLFPERDHYQEILENLRMKMYRLMGAEDALENTL